MAIMDDAAFDSLVKSLTATQHQYRIALGYLISEFATVEAEMQRTLRHYAGTNEAISKVIFKGLRTETTERFIRGILTDTNSPDLPTVTPLLEQLTVIRTARNDMIHYGAQVARASVQDGLLYIIHGDKHYPVPVIDLTNMISDLRKIRLRFENLRGVLDYATKLEWAAHPERKEEALCGPWLYKSPEQVRKQQAGKAHSKDRHK